MFRRVTHKPACRLQLANPGWIVYRPDEVAGMSAPRNIFLRMMRPAVVYLSRWKNHPRWSCAFLESIAFHDAGRDFDLLYVLKGFPPGEDDPALRAHPGDVRACVTEFRISDEGYDLNAYLRVAAQFEHRRMLFFNSYSRILARNWLASYVTAFDSAPNCGIVGATGSFETIPGTTFPNVNVRTNAFMIERELFLSVDPGPLVTKGDCNRFEAGPESLTRQIGRRGLEPLLVDRFGKPWCVSEWPVSRIFRSGRQEALLVADNRTHHYAVAGPAKRLRLARLAWGEVAAVPRISLASRLKSEIAWRWPGGRRPGG